jgi:pyruvate dehydrogenase E2 component (dihydrolipoamide acetyltransferase)
MKNVAVPDIGDYKDVSIIEVMVKVGDTIAAEDTLLTLETDKAAMDVPSPFAGVVKELKIKLGDKVSQGSVILVLESSDAAAPTVVAAPVAAAIAAAAPAPVVAAPVAAPAPVIAAPVAIQTVATPSGKKAHASPAMRRFARDTAAAGGNGLQVLASPVIDFAKYGAVEVKPLSRIKKISGANLHRNWVTIPHVTQFDEADITEMEAFRKQLGEEYAKQNIKITPLVFMLKAVVKALQRYPEFNASLDASGENLVYKNYFHIGVAVDTPDGLMVPVLRDVDTKGLVHLAKELGEISAKAREKKITAADMQGGCFSISSLGGIGGTAFTPIINAPEVAILGVSKSCMKPVYKDGEFVARLMLPLSLSYDHRVIDGALAARFTAYLAKVLSDIRLLAV